MARKPRVEFDGAFCHVIVGGNQRKEPSTMARTISNPSSTAASATARGSDGGRGEWAVGVLGSPMMCDDNQRVGAKAARATDR
jgi:hypothetical protein